MRLRRNNSYKTVPITDQIRLITPKKVIDDHLNLKKVLEVD
jgi:hypothetical protein